MMNTKRIVYLDVARGIGMLLVVMGHVEYIDIAIRQFIAAFHMPLFFLISGILIQERREEEKNFIALAKRKICNMMIPYAIFSILSFCIEGGRLAVKGLDGWDVVFRQLYQSFCLQGVSTLWFLPALLMSELIFIGLRRKSFHKGTVIISAVIVLLCICFNYAERAWYFAHAESLLCGMLHDILSMLLRNVLCVGFIAVGYYWNKIFAEKMKKVSWELFFSCVGGVITYVVVIRNGSMDLRTMSLQFAPLYLISAICGGLTVITLCRLFVKLPCEPLTKIFAFYGANSLIIMVTHMDFRVLNISIKVANLLVKGRPQILFCVLIVLFVFVLEIPIIWCVNQFLPFILGKKRKNS